MDNSKSTFKKVHSGNQFTQDAEARFFLASVLNSLQDSVVTINLDGMITSWNKGAELVYGYPASEAIGKSLDMLLFPEDFKALLLNIDRIRAGEQIELYDTFRLHKDGRHLHIEVTLSPVTTDRSEIIGVSTVARNVTELRKTQEALQLSESLLRVVLDAAVDFGVIVLDADGRIIDWNLGAKKLFGYEKEEVLGEPADIIFTEDDRHAGVPQTELATARRTGRAIDERWHLHKSGIRFFMSGVMTAFSSGQLCGFVKVARNITERKLAEEALFISEQRKSLAIKTAEMGEWEWDLSTDQITISEHVANLMGISTDIKKASPQFLLGLVRLEDREIVREAVSAAMNGLNILQVECRLIRADNAEMKWVSLYGRVVAHQADDASRLIGVVYDITPRKMLEQQKDDFISVAGHELKTPITAIKAYSELLLERFEDSDSRDEVLLVEKINSQVDRLTNLIKNLLDTSVLSEGRIQLAVQPLDLNEFIEANLDAMKAICPHHSISFEPGRAAIVHADRERILQVIINFIANAAKYSPVHTDIMVSTHDEQDKALIKVQDQGMGIPSDAQRLIFSRYYRATNAPDKKGFGLGLYICAEIIKQHNGSIGVFSTPGEGSTFYFSLPYV